MDSLTKPQPPAIEEYRRCSTPFKFGTTQKKTFSLRFSTFPTSILVTPLSGSAVFLRRFELTFPGSLGISFQAPSSLCKRTLRLVHATTALRNHFSQTKDISNLGRDAIRSFPCPIYPVEMGDELSTQLSKNPNFIPGRVGHANSDSAGRSGSRYQPRGLREKGQAPSATKAKANDLSGGHHSTLPLPWCRLIKCDFSGGKLH